VNPTGLDHDGQRELEQRAMRNVSWLAEKLGYRDALDRRQERWLVGAMLAILAVAIGFFAMSGAKKESSDRGDLELHRCQVEVRVQETDRLRADVMKDHPGVVVPERDRMVEEKLHGLMDTRCATR
jgi:hypothetical protein